MRARGPFCPLNGGWLVFREEESFLNILSIENDDTESITNRKLAAVNDLCAKKVAVTL